MLLKNFLLQKFNINKNFHSTGKTGNNLGSFNSLFNLYMLKKERIYTKLKYSRVPQFDMASGAIASLVAALIGFLITEKFG